MRFVLIAMGVAATGLLSTPSLADTVRCADAAGRVSVSFDIAFVDGERQSGAVTRVAADLVDFTLSTESTGADAAPEIIGNQLSEPGRLEVDLTDAEDIWIVLRLRLARDEAYDRQFGDDTGDDALAVVAGTLSAMGGGVWAVTCEGW